MPRRTRPPKRPLQPDPRYQNRSVQRFINAIMRDGKKSLAQRIVYGALEVVDERSNATGLETFEAALRNVTPQLEVKPRRVGEPRIRSRWKFVATGVTPLPYAGLFVLREAARVRPWSNDLLTS